MYRTFIAAFVIALVAGLTPESGKLLVKPEWLAAHLKDANLVILAMDQDDFESGHIPGARPFSYMDTHLMQSNGLSLEMPPAEQIAKTFAALGVSNNSRVVLYSDDHQLAPVARVWTTLELIGLGRQVSILDGGLAAWNAAHFPLAKGSAAQATGVLTPHPQADVVVDYDYVNAHLHQPGFTIIDARLEPFYTGARHAGGQRAGHIPGAVNIPFTSITHADGTVKSEADLADIFRSAGVKPGQSLIVYCHIGQQANAVRFAATMLGFKARLYDGSWEDWSRHAGAPAVSGK
ncbi:MAG TPA: sulfurtransferase [Terriglobales bacterium]|nr:sulfurtransferase [Terriglobales bacterium]